MNCLWCRGPVGKIPSFTSPDFCCSRCEHRFYSTGHKLDEDRDREKRLAREDQLRRDQLNWIEEDLLKIRKKHEEVLAETESAKSLNAAAFGYMIVATIMLLMAVLIHMK
jgi:hypothetical protein